MTRKIWWTDFTARDFDRVDPARTIALLPIAAIEQHGPHLPLGTDTLINRGCLDLLVARAPETLDLRILPLQEVGKSNEHVWAKGTITQPAATLIESWTALGLEAARSGIRKLVFVNSHGGNEEVMGIVARELRVRAAMFVVKTGWSRFGVPDGMLDDRERRHGIHGGDMETSLMLHFRPDLVDTGALADFPSVAARDEAAFTHLRPTGPHAYAWIASDLNPAGAVGNAARATAEKGAAIARHQVEGMLELLAEIARAEGFA